MIDAVVLDASALLCLLNAERGADRVAGALANSVISAVNFAEVVTKLIEAGGRRSRIELALEAFHLRVIAFDQAHATLAGMLRPQTKALGLSLGDRACLALAKHMSATAMTADRTWAKLPVSVGIRVEVIR